jgi:hypothetical protein
MKRSKIDKQDMVSGILEMAKETNDEAWGEGTLIITRPSAKENRKLLNPFRRYCDVANHWGYGASEARRPLNSQYQKGRRK